MAKKYAINRRFTYDGKTYYIRADSEKEFIEKKALKLRDLEEGKIILSGDMTVKAWAEQCISTYKTSQAPSTRKKYEARVKHCVLEYIGNMKLSKVRPLHCQQVLNLQDGNSKYQIDQVYQILNFLFSRAVSNHIILENPAKDLVKPKGTKEDRRAITPTEREHILKVAVTDRRYYIYLLMLHCGCRPEEASSIRGMDLYEENGHPMLHIPGTKTENAERDVPFNDVEFYNLIKNTPRFEYVACTSTGKQINESYRRAVWKSFKRQLNISMGCELFRNAILPPFRVAPDLVPYCLRHTYCTDLARKGVDIRMAKKLMGHSSIELVAKVYTNLDNNDVLNVAEILQGKVAPEVAPKPING